jgi:hypothetical protein
VRTALSLHVARGEEQIHQHGLAAPDIAMDVEAFDGAFRLVPGEQPTEMRRLALQPILREALLQPRQSCGDRFLRRIPLDLAFADECGVAFGNCRGHSAEVGGRVCARRDRAGDAPDMPPGTGRVNPF